MFHVRRRSADYQPRKRKKKPSAPTSLSEVDHSYRGHDEASLPFLVELNADGTDIRYAAPRSVRGSRHTGPYGDLGIQVRTRASRHPGPCGDLGTQVPAEV